MISGTFFNSTLISMYYCEKGTAFVCSYMAVLLNR